MRDDTFLKLMQNILSHCNDMLKANPGIMISSNATEDTVLHTVYFAGASYYLTLCPESKNILLYRLADVIADRLAHISEELSAPEGSFLLKNWPVPNDAERIAQDFCSDMRNRIVNDFRMTYGLDFTLIDDLSARSYEKGRCCGKLLFIPETSADIENHLTIKIQSKNEIHLSPKNLKQIRKLLAGAGENTLVFQNTEYGYAVRGFTRTPCPLLYGWQIHIRGVLEWHVGYSAGLKHADLFKIVRDIPQVINDPIEIAFAELVKEFPHLEPCTVVKDQIRYANEQDHGTSLIYVDLENCHVIEWLERLFFCERSLLTKMTDIKDMKSISAMDGGIVVDVSKNAGNDASVVYVATIVDGVAITSGLLDRGARHNSIYTFVSNLASKTCGQVGVVCALVFSEDGGISVFRGSQISPLEYNSNALL